MTPPSRFLGPALVLVVLATAVASPAHATCDRQGGILCNAPRDASQLAATYYTSYPFGFGAPVDNQANMAVAWTDALDSATTGSDIYMAIAAHCVDSAPSGGTPVCTDAGDQLHPALVASGTDVYGVGAASTFSLIVAWEDHRAATSQIRARRMVRAPGNAPASAWDAAAIAITNGPTDATMPAIGATQHGGAIIAWLDGPEGARRVRAQAVDSAGTILGPPDGLLLGVAGGDADQVTAVSDGAGGAWVAWATSGFVMFTRLDADGAPVAGWFAAGIGTTSNGVATDLRAAVDDMTLMLGWTNPGSSATYVTLLRQQTESTMTTRDFALGTRLHDLVVERNVPGAFAIWDRAGGENKHDLLATRVDTLLATVPGWPADVCIMCHPAHARAAGVGGLFVVFSDFRGDYNVYAGRWENDGSPTAGWTPNGTYVTQAPDDQIEPLVVPGGPGAIALAAPRPNPARAGATFRIELPASADAAIGVFDCAGRAVRSIASGTLGAGAHELRWDGRDGGGSPAAPGVYFVRASVGASVVQRPLVVLR